MRPVTVRTADLKNIIINLGFVGENEHRQIRFDAKKDFEEYPNASASLTVVPPEGESYPAIIERDGDFVLWTITDSDVIGEGDGEIQLAFTEGEVVKRTCIGRTKTDRSLVPTGSIPSGIDDFITRAGTLLEQVEETFPAGGTTGQVLAKKSDTDYDTEWVDQGGGTEDYDELENRPQIGGVTLTGNKTLHELGAASEGDVDAKYTKPAGGIPASDIADGVIPDPEDLIDDTAGEGDTDKVWSADKSHELLTEITQTTDTVKKLDLATFVAHDHLTVSGVRIKTDGKPTDMSSYSASPFIPVKAGYVIKFGMHCSDIAAAFAYYTTDQGNPEATYVVAGTGASVITSGEYTILADGFIRFCSSNSYSGEYMYFSNLEPDSNKKLLHDLQLNGTSIANNGTANIPYASANDPGVVKVGSGLYIGSSGKLQTSNAKTVNIKAGTDNNYPIVPSGQHEAVFYGLAKLAGADMKDSANPVGTFTATAIKKIQELLETRLLKGKKILVFGDSIWGNDRTDGIADFLAEYSSATVYNGAVGGTRITDLRSSQYDSPDYLYFDGVKLIHAFLTNTWTEQEAHKESVISYVKDETLPMLEALDASTIDMIILAYGHNDIAHGETLAQIQTAFETVIDDIRTYYPAIRIVMIAPPWRMFTNGTVDGDEFESSSGLTMRGLCDGMIQTAEKKHVTILDTFAELPICALTANTYMDNDHVHLNTTGNALYAHVVHGKLRSMF